MARCRGKHWYNIIQFSLSIKRAASKSCICDFYQKVTAGTLHANKTTRYALPRGCKHLRGSSSSNSPALQPGAGAATAATAIRASATIRNCVLAIVPLFFCCSAVKKGKGVSVVRCAGAHNKFNSFWSQVVTAWLRG